MHRCLLWKEYQLYTFTYTILMLPRFQDEQVEGGTQELTISEIQQKIKEYNAQINNNHYMVNVSHDILYSVYTFRYIKLPWELKVVLDDDDDDDFCRIGTDRLLGS